MLKHSILLLLGFIALASALTPTPEKNFFFLPYGAGLSTQTFQTRNGMVAYSVDLMQNGQYAPHYTQINMETNNVTEILQDLHTACGQGPVASNPLTYHVLTYSLVYYCTNNNSVLVIDPKSYEVKNVFSVSITETFDEVRLLTDGYSVTILGMSGIFTQNPGPSHLIKVSLQTMQITNHVVFDHDLATGEVVTGYGTNGNFFILTNIINSTINIANVYGMTLIGNSYSLTHLATFNSTGSYPYTLPEFWVNKNLIITNSEDTLVILSNTGNILEASRILSLNQFPIVSQPGSFLYRPVIVSYPGSGDIKALLQNYTLLKFQPQGSGYSVSSIGTYRGISLALQDQLTDTLLLSFSGPNDDFRMTNMDSSKVEYEQAANFSTFIITDKTYCAVSAYQDLLYIFDLQSDDLILAIPISNGGYYDQESSTITSLFVNGSNYELQQIDLRTGNTYNTTLSYSFSGSVILVHATNNENFDALQYIIHDITETTDSYLIVSQTLGQVTFSQQVSPNETFYSTVAVNYDTLNTFYFLHTGYSSPVMNVTEYRYDSTQKFFFSNNSNSNILYGNVIPGLDYSAITVGGQVAVIDMATLQQTEYSFSTQWNYDSVFQNSTKGLNMVLSQPPQWGRSSSQPAGILYNNQIQNLPGTTSGTVLAGTAGPCSYWVVNQVGCFANVQFYNICDSDGNISEIIA